MNYDLKDVTAKKLPARAVSNRTRLNCNPACETNQAYPKSEQRESDACGRWARSCMLSCTFCNQTISSHQ